MLVSTENEVILGLYACGSMFNRVYICNLITSGDNVPNWQFILLVIFGIITIVLHFMESKKLAKAFGKGTGFGVFLFLLGPIARLVLGFGSAQYQGNPER